MGSVESSNQMNGSIENKTNKIDISVLRPLPTRSNSSISLSSSSHSSFSRMGSLGSLPTNSGSSSPYYNNSSFDLVDEERIKSSIYNLKNHIKCIHKIKEEFRLLEESVGPSETSEGDKKHNTSKNRYTNILPVNHTRVQLKKIQDKEGSDYINANYIDGAYPKQFICTQGPLPNTIADFWRMVWENRCRIIVMLSRESENCRIKCDRYWPEQIGGEQFSIYGNGNEVFGTYSVELVEVIQDPEREIITRNIRLTFEGETRDITQYQYEGWPDHNIPDHTQPFRQLLHSITNRQNQIIPSSDRNVPIIVHCSAGVGRTGTFCTAVIMMKKLDHYFKQLDATPIDQVVDPFTHLPITEYQSDNLDLKGLGYHFKSSIYNSNGINNNNNNNLNNNNNINNNSNGSNNTPQTEPNNEEDDDDAAESDLKYAIMDKYNSRIDFNLFSIVLKLREQRPGMVQQLEQYLFCYKTILDEIYHRLNCKLGFSLPHVNNINNYNNYSNTTTTTTSSLASTTIIHPSTNSKLN
ncbi:protein-tyrosine phosphatase 1 [Dictyostelium discoideum AX4]|uniref:Tyrosine-protein phosphatase 1 n=1 Tax=Dictyostelium discoideum TaxID=44689 RepID=PTP1_DICDI|nr:protein-tyrosine phosphatase 1 [Dictyostelium discoideum AX4]XP_644725.1 protein-tyrosine phosphatase 1 [Dictyostelium discoideum AX4]P34137.2 RecName: Full=Tyrosine-protein phosphatase 1; AltName: Full=Protein-tyrosine-phosphate phosphohydrolase 1 [Dictyostelium discoideum]EAL70599.1 protein-tyrosine phosphatase 1 [Dictyostelium discoideum AX4]EAL70766.1 protein-tyrosine phosphatase 1 [Dictyostelium discoideum AX4]|eukprot:XP_644525.1 protein-tyrosine phosphatase 1 [Dictyostelium discoideum AX4]